MPNDPQSDYIAVEGKEVEPIEEGDSFLTQIGKMRDAGVDLYAALLMTVDLDKLKSEVAIYQMMGQIIEGEEMQQIYKLPLVILAWHEMVPDDEMTATEDQHADS